MIIDVVTLFPEMFEAICAGGVVARAIEQGRVTMNCWDLREYGEGPYRRCDDRPYGGGPGMVMMAEPLTRCVEEIKAQANGKVRVIALSPDGQLLKQRFLRESAQGRQHFVLICGRYEGFDQRFIELIVDECWSIGDYVLSGGELAAMVVIDGLSRLIPGVLGDDQSAVQESFTESVLDCPHYTRPEDFRGLRVPNVLLSGNHAEISRWRAEQAHERTQLKRPDILED